MITTRIQKYTRSMQADACVIYTNNEKEDIFAGSFSSE
jgi:hypothetical protein